MGGLFHGPKTNTTQQQQTNQTSTGQVNQTGSQQGSQSQTGQTNQTSTQTSTPNLPPWLQAFLPGVASSLQQNFNNVQNLQKPVYGPAQQADYQQNLNTIYNQASKDAQSKLAASGALNSARAGQVQSGIDVAKAGAMGNYLAQVPLMNRQAALQAAGLGNSAVSAMASFNPTASYGATTTGSSQQNIMNQILSSLLNQNQTNSQSSSSGTSTGTGTSQTNQNPFTSIFGGLMGGLGSIFGL